MSYYVYGSKMSYGDYLTAKSFVGDLSSATLKAGREVSLEISRQTRGVIASNEELARDSIRVVEANTEALNAGFDQLSYGFDNISKEISRRTRDVIASNEAMARDNIRAVEANTKALNAGFDRLSYGLDNISSGISELNGTFHWGFCEIIASIGHMNDTLSELIKIAKTPVQTVAFNHFEIARDAYRQELYKEALDELEKAISGDHASSGYKLEWRFHQMKGTLQLGFVGADMALVDLAKAEESFLLAARYGRADYPEDAGRAYLSAGWAAYCQGRMKEALAYTEQAMALHPRMGEAFFQAAKVHMALGQADTALPVLARAIDIDRFYALKAAGDGDFQKYDRKLRGFLDALRQEKYRQSIPKVKAAIEQINSMGLAPGAVDSKALKCIQAFLSEGAGWPLMDMLNVVQNLDAVIAEAKRLPGIVRIKSSPGPEIFFEFCPIPAGTFVMGEGSESHQMTLTKDFHLGKYPVTQKQWQAIMGENPSNFKGDNLPVERVSWDDCQGFIQKLNSLAGKQICRLPTEAEWEYACRAGSTTAYCYGDDEGRLGEYAWYAGNSGGTTHAVGQKNPNAWGLHDMHGNVWEWCQDRYGDLSASAVSNPKGLTSGEDHALRGGSWYYFAKRARAADRRRASSGSRFSNVGFRLARTL